VKSVSVLILRKLFLGKYCILGKFNHKLHVNKKAQVYITRQIQNRVSLFHILLIQTIESIFYKTPSLTRKVLALRQPRLSHNTDRSEIVS